MALGPGVYVASVTPFDARGAVDPAGVARLLAWFESCGCRGAVMAGTNGEGPSLSAIEKRDLVRTAEPLRGGLEIIAGVATASLDEAVWSCTQAQKSGAEAALVMAPGYFREASERGIEEWFVALFDRISIPVLVYNFPQRTGITISPDLLGRLARHERMLGAKDSSSSVSNLTDYRQAAPEKLLFVGDEALLLQALDAGWTGTISGSSNVVGLGLSAFMADYLEGRRESAEAKFALLKPGLERLRRSPQPATNKAILQRLGVLENPAPRLPLLPAEEGVVEELLPSLRGFY